MQFHLIPITDFIVTIKLLVSLLIYEMHIKINTAVLYTRSLLDVRKVEDRHELIKKLN